MALFIKNGEFWGEFEYNHERTRFRLGVQVCGQPPPHLKLLGDVVFERARTRALVEFETLKKEFTDPKKSVDRLSRIHLLATGKDVLQIKPGELFEVWMQARRRKTTLALRHVSNVQTTLTRFVAFLRVSHPKLTDYLGVSKAIASEFMAKVEASGVSNKTYDNVLITMRAAFNAAGQKAENPHNPFSGIPKKEDKTVHRRPYAKDVLEYIIQAASEDLIVGPVIITAACSPRRQVDLGATTVKNPHRVVAGDSQKPAVSG